MGCDQVREGTAYRIHTSIHHWQQTKPDTCKTQGHQAKGQASTWEIVMYLSKQPQTIGFILSSSKGPCKLLNALELQKENGRVQRQPQASCPRYAAVSLLTGRTLVWPLALAPARAP